MKTVFALILSAIVPTVGLSAGDSLGGEDFVVNCVSDRTGGAVTLARSGASNLGYIIADEIQGEATIHSGLNSLTFLHIMGKDVMTFVVNFQSLTFDLTVNGPHARQDRGHCEDPFG